MTVSNISVGTGAWTCAYTLSVPSGASNLTFDLSGGTGDGDMYVKLGSEPTSSSYDCRPYKSGNTENCTFSAPSAGTYYVKIYGSSSASGMSLKGAYSTSGGGGTLSDGVESAQYSGAKDSWTCNTLVVPSGTSSVVFNQTGKSGTSGDADLYVRFGSAPTASSCNCRPYLNGSTESCTINSPSAGTWYACSYGYSAYTNVTMKGTYQPCAEAALKSGRPGASMLPGVFVIRVVLPGRGASSAEVPGIWASQCVRLLQKHRVRWATLPRCVFGRECGLRSSVLRLPQLRLRVPRGPR